MTQSQRVLNALQRAGRYGVTAVDFLGPNVTDDGPPITRVAARIKDLKEAGHRIVVAGTRDKCVVYRLLEDVAPGDAGRRHPPSVGERSPGAALFSIGEAKQARPHWDEAA